MASHGTQNEGCQKRRNKGKRTRGEKVQSHGGKKNHGEVGIWSRNRFGQSTKETERNPKEELKENVHNHELCQHCGETTLYEKWRYRCEQCCKFWCSASCRTWRKEQACGNVQQTMKDLGALGHGREHQRRPHGSDRCKPFCVEAGQHTNDFV